MDKVVFGWDRVDVVGDGRKEGGWYLSFLLLFFPCFSWFVRLFVWV